MLTKALARGHVVEDGPPLAGLQSCCDLPEAPIDLLSRLLGLGTGPPPAGRAPPSGHHWQLFSSSVMGKRPLVNCGFLSLTVVRSGGEGCDVPAQQVPQPVHGVHRCGR
jgi:hypothetical protein